MISQFFVLSLRGDTIVSRDYIGDVQKVKTSAEVFYHKVKRWSEDSEDEAPPVFCVEGVQYFHMKMGGVFLVATSRKNVSPALILELLHRVANIIKDYCGVLNEESVRQNFVLFYELVDEIIDYGYPQNTTTQVLKRYVLNTPILPEQLPMKAGNLLIKREGLAPMISKSVMHRSKDGKKGEIYVDIIEKLSITFNSSGYVQNSAIDGTIQVKSYLSGSPLVKIALNDDLQIAGRDGASRSSYSEYGTLLDDCNFYEQANLDNFDIDRTLTLSPSQGEFSLMNYRTTGEVTPPFRVYTSLHDMAPFKVELLMKIRAEYPAKIVAPTLSLSIPVPKGTVSISFPQDKTKQAKQTRPQPPGTFLEKEKKMTWNLQKIQGGSEITLVARVSLNSQSSSGANVKKEFGPVSLQFSLPMYNASKLQVKYLQILNSNLDKNQNPSRWVRYITESSSYIFRM